MSKTGKSPKCPNPYCKKDISINAVFCPNCGETKFIKERIGSRKIHCNDCWGRGYHDSMGDDHGNHYGRSTCPECKGEGQCFPKEQYDSRDGHLLYPEHSIEKQYQMKPRYASSGGCYAPPSGDVLSSSSSLWE